MAKVTIPNRKPAANPAPSPAPVLKPVPVEETPVVSLSVPTQADAAETANVVDMALKAAPAPTAVSVKSSDKDLVQVTVFQAIEPPPHVGNWNGARELGILKMTPKSTYKVPRYVANVMVESTRAAILGE